MRDKLCLITGANSGIGFELAKGMAANDYITMIGGNSMSSNVDVPKVVQAVSPRQWIRLVVVYLFIPLVLLVCGGDFDWWQAWGYALLIVAASLGGRIWAERRHPGLLAERQNMEKVQSAKAWIKCLRR